MVKLLGASLLRLQLICPRIHSFSYSTDIYEGPQCIFPGGSAVKNPPAMQETWVRSLGREDPLEKEMATQASTLAWRIPRTEEPVRLQSMGLPRVRDDFVIKPPHCTNPGSTK